MKSPTKTRQWVPILSLLALASTLSAPAVARDGGTSSNGGGGNQFDSSNYHPVGALGAAIFGSLKGQAYAERLQGFRQEDPQVQIVTCSADDPTLAYPVLPRALKGAFVFESQSRFFFKDLSPQALTPETLCADRGLLETYGNLVLELHAVVKSDPVTDHLIRKVTELGGPIPMVLRTSTKKFRVNGGSLEEFSWFDPATGKIFWAQRPACRGIACFKDRTDRSFLRHELAHLLLARSLGSKYPQAEVWHDIRPLAREKFVLDRNWLQEQTSVGAAYVEGIANALEAQEAMQDHPHRRDAGDFNHLSKTEQGLCYWEPEAIRDDGKQLRAAEDNETYLSSSIAALFRTESPSEPDPLLEAHAGVVHVSVDPEVQKAFIDAIAQAAPQDPQELAKALDARLQGNLGYLWLREYYFTDYRTGKNIRDEFRLEPRKPFFSTDTATRTFCIDSGQASQFLSPVRQAQYQALKLEGERKLADHTPDAQVSNNALNVLEEVETKYAAFRANGGSPQDLEKAGQDSAQKLGYCSGKALVVNERNRDLVKEIYSRIEDGGTDHASLTDILEMLRRVCEGTVAAPTETLEARIAQARPFGSFDSRGLSREDRAAKIQDWVRAKAELKWQYKELFTQYVVYQAASAIAAGK